MIRLMCTDAFYEPESPVSLLQIADRQSCPSQQRVSSARGQYFLFSGKSVHLLVSSTPMVPQSLHYSFSRYPHRQPHWRGGRQTECFTLLHTCGPLWSPPTTRWDKYAFGSSRLFKDNVQKKRRISPCGWRVQAKLSSSLYRKGRWMLIILKC